MGAAVVFLVGSESKGTAVHGLPSSLRPELEALCLAVETAPSDRPLTVLTDSLNSLLLLMHAQRRDFGKDLMRHTERSRIRRLILAINDRAASETSTCLAKVKSHRGEPLNESADRAADDAVDAAPWLGTEMNSAKCTFYVTTEAQRQGPDSGETRRMLWGPPLKRLLTEWLASKYVNRLKRIRTSRDTEPTNADANMVEAPARKRQMMTWCETRYLRGHCGRKHLGGCLAAMADEAPKRRLLQALTDTYPCQANLFRWNKVESPRCPRCNMDS